MRTQADHAEYDWYAGPSDDQVAAETEAGRCRQLADLEREIGRAVIRLYIIDNMRDHYDNEQWDATVYQSILRADALLHDQSDRAELLRLVTRWRELHAEGAEEGGA